MSFDARLKPPRAAKIPVRSTHHGIERTDDYGWMRAGNWQEATSDPQLLEKRIRDHLEAENAFMAAQMADTAELQKTLMAEMRGRIQEDDSSAPMKDGPWAYSTRFAVGDEHPKFMRAPVGGGEPALLLDGDLEARGKEYFRIGGAGHSPDHRLLSWSCDDKGSERYALIFRDLDTAKDLPHRIAHSSGGGVFSRDSRQFLYTRIDANHRPSKLLLHTIGDDPAGDILIREEPNPQYFLGAGKTQSGDYMVISSNDHDSVESWLIPADRPQAEPLLIAARHDQHQYSVDEGGGVVYILTNRDGAKDFKIVTAPAATPQPEHWRDLVAHRSGRLILGHNAFKRHVVWLERENGLPRILIHRIADGMEHAIAFDEEAYSLGMGGALEFDTDIIRFSYSSPSTPSRTYDYNMESRERALVKEQVVPSGHDPEDYVTRRGMAPAGDGETVPVTLLHRKDTPIDGSAPCLLYGYGSYGITIPASFNSDVLSLVDRGFVHAVAHVRGGKDKGYGWYEDGKLDRKNNTFNDFIAVAEHLIQAGFTARGRIVAEGRSAGGLLIGAVVNMAPELFAGFIAGVPFVDVLNTMLDDTLPLTPPEWSEWGNPLASRETYDTIASYSPYDRISRQAYPPILAVAGLSDPRVTYWEPAKWVAKLRDHQTGNAPIMLKTFMGAGHSGSSGRFQRLEDTALTYAFAIKAAGLGG